VARLPHIELPVRGLENVSYDAATGTGTRDGAQDAHLTVNTVRTFGPDPSVEARFARDGAARRFRHQREAYTSARTGAIAASTSRAESDAIMDDIEALAVTAWAVA